MKKTRLLNAQVSALIASVGHTETIAIADCGLPIGEEAPRIDLALELGVPGFLQTLDVVLSELHIESAVLAEEIKTASPALHAAILERLGGAPVFYVPHEQFKQQAQASRGIIRTGEATPYANILLVSGVTFS